MSQLKSTKLRRKRMKRAEMWPPAARAECILESRQFSVFLTANYVVEPLPASQAQLSKARVISGEATAALLYVRARVELVAFAFIWESHTRRSLLLRRAASLFCRLLDVRSSVACPYRGEITWFLQECNIKTWITVFFIHLNVIIRWRYSMRAITLTK